MFYPLAGFEPMAFPSLATSGIGKRLKVLFPHCAYRSLIFLVQFD
jgi:hypothetical protein